MPLSERTQYTGAGLYRQLLVACSCGILFLTANPSHADCADELVNLEGYTIIAVKTIEGWYDDDEKDESSFNGCSHGRVIVFTDGTGLTCAEYGYMYAYRPTAVIFAKEISWKGKSFYDLKMMVEDEVFDMQR